MALGRVSFYPSRYAAGKACRRISGTIPSRCGGGWFRPGGAGKTGAIGAGVKEISGRALQAGPSHPTSGACSTSVVRSLPIVRAGRRLFQGRNDYATTCTPYCLHMAVQIGLTARLPHLHTHLCPDSLPSDHETGAVNGAVRDASPKRPSRAPRRGESTSIRWVNAGLATRKRVGKETAIIVPAGQSPFSGPPRHTFGPANR